MALLRKWLPVILQVLTALLGGGALSDYRLASVPGAEVSLAVGGVPLSSVAMALAAVGTAVGSVYAAPVATQAASSVCEWCGLIAQSFAREGDTTGLQLIGEVSAHASKDPA